MVGFAAAKNQKQETNKANKLNRDPVNAREVTTEQRSFPSRLSSHQHIPLSFSTFSQRFIEPTRREDVPLNAKQEQESRLDTAGQSEAAKLFLRGR